MAWVDIIVGALIGMMIALLFSRLFITKPKTTITLVIIFAILGIFLSDNYLTRRDKRWNLINKVWIHIKND